MLQNGRTAYFLIISLVLFSNVIQDFLKSCSSEYFTLPPKMVNYGYLVFKTYPFEVLLVMLFHFLRELEQI